MALTIIQMSEKTATSKLGILKSETKVVMVVIDVNGEPATFAVLLVML